MKKSEDLKALQTSNSSEALGAKSADQLQPMPITSSLRDLEDTTLSTIFNHSVEDVTHLPTLSEFENSLDEMDHELDMQDANADSQTLAFLGVTLANFSKEEDGGYTLTFNIPEMDRKALGDLIQYGHNIFNLFLSDF